MKRDKNKGLTVGVLALQGAVDKHLEMLKRCGCKTKTVRNSEELKDINALVIPGGESTTIGKLLQRCNLDKEIILRVKEGSLPIFGTCAGLVLLSKNIGGNSPPLLGLMDISSVRNAFGRQKMSFETALNIPALGEKAFPGIFIRAPYISRVGDKVEVLAKFEERVVLAKEGNLLACAFHPELTNDLRVHQYFLEQF